MESLSDETWDVILSGTGLPQSLLALALSRSGKKVLHIDKNDYYGGSEAALSLQEAEAWADAVNREAKTSPFRNATVLDKIKDEVTQSSEESTQKLGFSRAYSLSLAQQLIYTRSNLLPALVSSKVYRQLEFLAVGSWWLYEQEQKNTPGEKEEPIAQRGSLRRIPGGREDVFADKSIDLRSTRLLMKFLKLAADPQSHASILQEWGNTPFPEFLESHLNISPKLQTPLLALTATPKTPAETSTSYALPRIHRHLTSIGIFGPGFGAVIPKWGGLAEVAQVSCRAGAVGGGVYVLKKGFEEKKGEREQALGDNGVRYDEGTGLSTVRLEGGDEVKAKWIVGSLWDLPSHSQAHKQVHDVEPNFITRSITIVSGTLSKLFPLLAEGAPPPAGTVIMFPTGRLERKLEKQTTEGSSTSPPPLYLMIHSSDTGECPAGQCIIYAQIAHPKHSEPHSLLQQAVKTLLASVQEVPSPSILWTLQYNQIYLSPEQPAAHDANVNFDKISNDHVLQLPDVAPDLALDDDVLKHVQAAYERIVGQEGAAFMLFEDREGTGDADNGTQGEGV